MRLITPERLLPAALLFLAAALPGCTPPQYDDQTDKLITTLQTDTDSFLIGLISADDQIKLYTGRADATSIAALATAQKSASYAASIAAYNKLRVDDLSLQLRIDAEPNAATADLDQALAAIQANLFGPDGLEAEHQTETIMGETYIALQQKTLDTQFAALLSYELALKSGKPAT